jgi:glycosyltransferase involved in cell wall biosynthesis
VSERPALSVVLPNYNDAALLPLALESIVKQTRPADEVIVVDDGSTDSSPAVVESFAKKHPSVRLLRFEKNRGVLAVQSAGLAEVKGRWLHFAASDDAYKPALYERSLAMLEKNPSAGLCSAISECIDEEGRALPSLPAAPLVDPARFVPAAEARDFLLRFDSWIMGNTTVFNTDALRAEGGFPADLGPFSDGFIGRVLALKHGACFVPEPLAVWRRSTGGYATRTASDIEASLKIVDAASAAMRGRYRDLFPESYVAYWRERALFETLRNASAAHGAGLERAKAALGIPSPRAQGFFLLACALNRLERLGAWAATASWPNFLARRRGKMEGA